MYYCACALNYYAQFYSNCDCEGEVGEDRVVEQIKQQEADWFADAQDVWEQAWLEQYEIAKAMSIYGILISLIAIVVVSKVDLLIPVIAL